MYQLKQNIFIQDNTANQIVSVKMLFSPNIHTFTLVHTPTQYSETSKMKLLHALIELLRHLPLVASKNGECRQKALQMWEHILHNINYRIKTRLCVSNSHYTYSTTNPI